MYEDRRNSFSLRDIILQLLIIVLFILVMIWLFPTKSYLNDNYVTIESVEEQIDESLEGLYGRLFADNIESMKQAAKDYFTVSKLPKKVGDTVTLTLKEMLDKKLVLEIKDSNNNSCDTTKSYVEVTKMDNDYQMKVQLTCEDHSDYVIVTLGCYDLCGESCETTTTQTTTKPSTSKPSTTTPVVKKYLYEYRLDIKDTYSNWSDWSSWTRTKLTANNLTQVEVTTKEEIVGYEQEKYVVRYDYEYYTDYVDVTNEVQVGTTSKKVGTEQITTVVDTKDAKKTNNGTYSAWKKVDTVTTTNEVLYNTDTIKYVLKSTNKVLNCENSCVYDTVRVYEKQTRTYTAGSDTYSCATYGSDYKLSGTKCVKSVTKTVDIYEDVPVYETITETVPVTRENRVPVYGYRNGKPIMETVTYYRSRTRKQLTKADTIYKYSTNNDKTLLDAGYVLTGNKKEAK